jgi:hypothetical protein
MAKPLAPSAVLAPALPAATNRPKGPRRRGRGPYGKAGAQAAQAGLDFGGRVRASQAVSTYGPGSLIDLLKEAVLVAIPVG